MSEIAGVGKDNDKAKRDAVDGFIRSEACREISLRCVRAGCRPDVLIGGIARSVECSSFFDWVVGQYGECLGERRVMSRGLEACGIGNINAQDIERECRELRFMRELIEEISDIFFVRRMGSSVGKKWILASRVDWNRVLEMITRVEFNFLASTIV